jgi:hypothetical protein
MYTPFLVCSILNIRNRKYLQPLLFQQDLDNICNSSTLATWQYFLKISISIKNALTSKSEKNLASRCTKTPKPNPFLNLRPSQHSLFWFQTDRLQHFHRFFFYKEVIGSQHANTKIPISDFGNVRHENNIWDLNFASSRLSRFSAWFNEINSKTFINVIYKGKNEPNNAHMFFIRQQKIYAWLNLGNMNANKHIFLVAIRPIVHQPHFSNFIDQSWNNYLRSSWFIFFPPEGQWGTGITIPSILTAKS